MRPLSTVALRRYLLEGRLSRRGCVAGPSAVLPCISTRRALYRPRQCMSLHTNHAATVETPQPPAVPLRKKMKDEAKLAKQNKGKNSKVDSQTVDGWELTVGIEIHAQLNTARKLFSPSVTRYDDVPNSHVSFFDVSTPGSHPLLQKQTLIPALRAALALNCDIQRLSRFDRKHYFWWDQPSGYQITQYYQPFAKNGHIKLLARDGISPQDGESVTVGIKQVQMEQDTAKTLAKPGNAQWLDFNRVGVPLIEIITEPEIHHPRTAAVLVRKIQRLLHVVDACVTGMESGGLRADVNVSVRRTGDASQKLGTRTEIKNISSIKAVEDAIIAERDRQIRELEAGKEILGETRGWTLGSTETRRLRGKEGEVDYRYMPDPDVPPLIIGEDVVTHLQNSLTVLPDDEVNRLVDHYGLTPKDALSLFTSDKGYRCQYFYRVVDLVEERLNADTASSQPDLKSYGALAGNWVLHELGRLEKARADDAASASLDFTSAGECAQIPSSDLAELLCYLFRKQITGKVAKELLLAIFLGEVQGGLVTIIEENDLWFREISESEYQELAEEAIVGEDKTLQQFVGYKVYPQGKLMYLVGKMMRLGPTENIHPPTAERVMRARLERLGP